MSATEDETDPTPCAFADRISAHGRAGPHHLAGLPRPPRWRPSPRSLACARLRCAAGSRASKRSGLAGLEEKARPGRPATDTPAQVSEVIPHQPDEAPGPRPAVCVLDPRSLTGLSAVRSRALRWKRKPHGRAVCWRQVYAGASRKRGLASGLIPPSPKNGGHHDALYGAAPRECRRVSGCDGPRARQEFSGPAVGGESRNRLPPPSRRGASAALTPPGCPAHRPAPWDGHAKRSDYGRLGKGYLFGAFTPADGEALTAPDAGRTTANYGDFLAPVEAWIAPDVDRLYAIMDHLNAHRADRYPPCAHGRTPAGLRLPADVCTLL